VPAVRRIPHGELTLALHELRRGGEDAPRLLLVHALGGSVRDWIAAGGGETPVPWESWPGGVLALDLAGHGESERRLGGAYTPELFAADIDAVLAEVGACALAGAGVGAYAALLVAGARPDLVPAALLLPGAGLDGGGALPSGGRAPSAIDDEHVRAQDGHAGGAVGADPLVRTCAEDIRPTDYAGSFAAAARRLLLAEDGSPRPPWWEAVRAAPAARSLPLASPGAAAAIDELARAL
jgi:pimeloyl-ACP methyl ester carboxylesterase